MHFDETFLVFISLVIFVSLLLYFRIPSIIFSILDARANRISDDILEAKRAKEEAENLLLQCKEKYSQVEKEVSEIILASKQRAEFLEEENRKKIQKVFDMRIADLEKRIIYMESEAMSSFYTRLADFSINISKEIISEKMNDDVISHIFEKAIIDLKSHHKI